MWSLGKLSHLPAMDSERPAGVPGTSRVPSPTPKHVHPPRKEESRLCGQGKPHWPSPPCPSRDVPHSILGLGRAWPALTQAGNARLAQWTNTGKVPRPPHQVLNESTMEVPITWESSGRCELIQWAIGGGGD